MNSATTTTVNATRPSRPSHQRIARMALVLVGALAVLAGTNRAAAAQTSPEQTAEEQPTDQKRTWDFVVTSGLMVPTGAQRDAIKRGNMTVAELSYAVRPPIAITASLGWARSQDIATVVDPKLDVFTYDIGTEFRGPRWGARDAVNFRPFAGAGAGARSYNSRRLESDATHQVATYLSAGGELGLRRVGLRVELRDYVTGFAFDGGGPAGTRNDVAVMVGLRFGTR